MGLVEERPAAARSADRAWVRVERALLVALCVHAVADKLRPQALKPKLKMWYAALPPAAGCRRITRMASLRPAQTPPFGTCSGLPRSVPCRHQVALCTSVPFANCSNKAGRRNPQQLCC